jgi:hypothetical protein
VRIGRPREKRGTIPVLQLHEMPIYSIVLGLLYVTLTARSNADDPMVPVHLLIYAMQTAITTSTCIADYLSWSNFSSSEKIELGKLYVPYLALCEYLLPFMQIV